VTPLTHDPRFLLVGGIFSMAIYFDMKYPGFLARHSINDVWHHSLNLNQRDATILLNKVAGI
jgi:hypothetical protein